MNRVTTRRGLLIALGASTLTWTGAARAQAPATVRRIGVLSPVSASEAASWHQAFRLGLRELGWVEGKNISIEYRYAEGRGDRLPDLAADLVRIKVEIILAGFISDALAAKKATKTIPIVTATASDPVGSGLVENLARPGGNVTGLSQMGPVLAGKRLELLKEIIPELSRLAVLWNSQGAGATLTWKELQLPARQLGIQLHSLEVSSPREFNKAFEDATKAGAGALLILGDPVTTASLKPLADLAAKSRLPSLFQLSEFADAGGLLTYGVDLPDLFRRAATYVDKILRGAKPGDLPIDQATKFELVINLKTANTLGIRIPRSVLMRADRVIK